MKKETAIVIMLALTLASVLMIGLNSYALSKIQLSGNGNTVAQATQQKQVLGQPQAQQAALQGPDILPQGVPAVYGPELGVSFDDVSADNSAKADETIRKLGRLDVDITLDDAQKQRYINILYKMENGIACEYCCGARSVIFPNGEPACGCAHSYAMRGLTKYLLTEHADEFTDAQILEENGKWKVLFFPGILTQKAAVLQSKGIELNYINIASNKYRGAEKETAAATGGGSMVGGC